VVRASTPGGGGLVELADSTLIIIDVQERFLDKLPEPAATSLVARIRWLVKVADHLRVPVMATAEDISRLGSLVPDVLAAIPGGTRVYDKLVFGLAADSAILGGLAATGRRTCVLVGLETDVCVAQSAVGLIQQGYGVVVLEDGTGSPEHEAGIHRVERAGALVMPIRTLLYEWLQTVEAAGRLRRELFEAYPPPPDVVL
jgi:nicotinamidase-related amidase